MFTRYVSPDHRSIEREFDLVPTAWEIPDNFNVAPRSAVPVIRVIDGQPDQTVLHWGFGDPVTHEVMGESLLPDGGILATSQRCILPAMGFYLLEGLAESRRPYFVHVEDQAVFGIAGFWERDICLSVTLPGDSLVRELGGAGARMPAILTREARDIWLYGSARYAATVLCAYPSAAISAYAVSDRVCSLDTNDEALIEPLETEVD